MNEPVVVVPDQMFCDHCSGYFLSTLPACPDCGATVDTVAGCTITADGHRWTPPGAPVCQECLAAFVRRVAALDDDEQLELFADGDDPFTVLLGIITEARTLLGLPVSRHAPDVVDVVVAGDVL